MNHISRRNWLKTAGLSSGMIFLGGLDTMASEINTRKMVAGRMVQLNANENPYSPSLNIQKVLTKNFELTCRYPFRILSGLVEAIAAKEGVDKDHIVITGGSTEGLKAAGLIYGRDGREIVAADPTFQALLRYAESFNGVVHRVRVNKAMEHDLTAMAAKINSKTGLVFICNPNNPTGTILDGNELKEFCLAHEKRVTIFCDEAYYDFITAPEYPSMIDLVKKGKNVIVSKTFSKAYGLAGLRVGYLVAKPDIAKKLKAGVMANTNVLAIAAAREALLDTDFYKFSIAKNMEAKQMIYKTLENLNLNYIKSHTNFVFFESGRPVSSLIESMKRENVLIGRPFPPMDLWARISTGTLQEMDLFSKALHKVMA